MKYIFLFLLTTNAIAQDECLDWLHESKAKIGTKECFFQCSIHSVGMSTWVCSNRCGEMCQFKQKVHYFFGNGMFNTIQDAWTSSASLSIQLNKEIKQYPDLIAITHPLKVHLAYNSNETVFMQLLQVAYQKTTMEEGDFFRWLSDLNKAPDWFRKAARGLSRFNLEAFKVADSDLRDHLNQYETILKKGDAIIIISHSQGNLYSHAALSHFGWQSAMRIIPIASPYFVETSEKIFNGSPYSTLFSDGIIKAIPGSYPPNVSNPNPGWFDHSFTKHYLGGANSGPKILNDTMCMTGVFLMRMRPTKGISDLWNSDWDHPSCQGLTPHPEAVRDEGWLNE